MSDIYNILFLCMHYYVVARLSLIMYSLIRRFTHAFHYLK